MFTHSGFVFINFLLSDAVKKNNYFLNIPYRYISTITILLSK